MQIKYTESPFWMNLDVLNILQIYEINQYGEIRYKETEIYITQYLNKTTGYFCVNLRTRDDKYAKSFTVHRLVALMFVSGYSETNNVVDHIDCDKTNNFYKNLEWVTMRENNARARKNGLINNTRGTGIGTNILPEELVSLICKLLVKYDGKVFKVMRTLSIMNIHIGNHLIYQIKNKKTWSWISDKYFSKDQFDLIRENEVKKICEELIKSNGKISEVLSILKNEIPDIDYSIIKDIKHKKHWKEISDKYFDDTYFSKQTEILPEHVHMICKALIEYDGIGSIVYKQLKDKIPGLSYPRIQNIKYKRSWSHISDNYFQKGYFSK